MRALSDFEAVYLHRDVVDFRKSINGLSIIVEQGMNLSAFDSAIFVFCNRSRDKLKILYWDKTGFCLWYKRLEHDKFQWPKKSSSNVMALTSEQMDWLLRGFDITKLKSHSPTIYGTLS